MGDTVGIVIVQAYANEQDEKILNKDLHLIWTLLC